MTSTPTPPPQTLAERIRTLALQFEEQLRPLATGTLTDWTRSSGEFVFISPTPYRWSPLSVDEARLQTRALASYRRFVDLLGVLLRERPTEELKTFEDNAQQVIEFLERQPSAFLNPERALEHVVAALRNQVDEVSRLFSASDGTLLVLDTNALYWNPALEQWRCPWDGPFTFVLTPTVVGELDRHKEDSRNAVRQAKAERLIRQIGEYRRRGDLSSGVPIVRGISTILTVAAEPKVERSLPWLDASVPDDRLLASAIEVMRENTAATVLIVARDLNLQNKAEFAQLPTMAPAEFVAQA